MSPRNLFTCLLLLFFATNAHAWGWDGHRLVCAIAQARLTPAATAMVDNLLVDGESLKGGQVTFPEACLWPDDVKYSTRKGSYEHHFINVPDDAMTVDLQRDCAALNCIAVGVQKALTYLSTPPDSDRARARQAAALRFLGHYIGDLHQPLHIGNASDWGGNKIKVQWQGKETNLHALWDYTMLESIGVTYPDSVPFLLSVKVPASENRTDADPNIHHWFNESLRLGRSNAYSHPDGHLIRTGETLGQAYLERNKPVLIERLVLAGDRLATLLNEIAAGQQPRPFQLKTP